MRCLVPVNDRVKLLAYRIFDPVKKAGTKPETKAVDPEPKAKVEQKPEAKASTTSDLTPQIAKRAYELYEQQGHRDGQSVQNWDKAEQEIREDQIKAEPKTEPKDKPRAEAKVEPTPETQVEPKPDGKPDTQPEATAEPKPEAKTEPAPKSKPHPNLFPQP